ncbi:MAG: hypothetical protein HY040_00355 [Planctomycetes bacterium]|nr:hypothetical protein [Planctomycetota bacterium]
METSPRICPHCHIVALGTQPGAGSVCARCGRSFVATKSFSNGSMNGGLNQPAAAFRPAVGILEPTRRPKKTTAKGAMPSTAPFLAAPSETPETYGRRKLWGLLIAGIIVLALAGLGGLAVLPFLSDTGSAKSQTHASTEKKRPEAPQVADAASTAVEVRATDPLTPPTAPGQEPAPRPAQSQTPRPEDKPAPPNAKPVEDNRQPMPPEPKALGPRLPAGLAQARIDDSIGRGVKYLKSTQNPTGMFGPGVGRMGFCALPALTLLECGVSAKDPAIQKAAALLRKNAPSVFMTYDLSLTILFFDRLGDPADKPLIQNMAARLIAGQGDAGGWSYNVPILSTKDQGELLAFLRKSRPKLHDPLAGGRTDTNPIGKPGETPNVLAKDDPDLFNPFGQKEQLKNGADQKAGVEQKAVADPKAAAPGAKAAPPRPEALPAHLRQIPAVAMPGKPNMKEKGPFLKEKGPFGRMDRDDNSNTQFALLALWAARRHDVPTERSLQIAYKRFIDSQDEYYGWGYKIHKPNGSPAMIGVGLLGLAMGHGTSAEIPLDDRRIKSGLEAFSRHIQPAIPDPSESENLYFLWTLERVAMLYNLSTICGKDWYGWGAPMLLTRQNTAGSWSLGNYNGSHETIDTCFALLFLKRSNLVQDLTERLQFQMPIADTESKIKNK